MGLNIKKPAQHWYSFNDVQMMSMQSSVARFKVAEKLFGARPQAVDVTVGKKSEGMCQTPLVISMSSVTGG